MKKCTKCGIEKCFSEFCKKTASKDGYQPACKSCMNKAYTKCRKQDQERYQQVAKERYSANVIRMREWKSARGCRLCSETFAQCLDLHHLDPTVKDFNPCEAYCMSWDSFIKEAAKCVVLCANCHRKVHAGVLTI